MKSVINEASSIAKAIDQAWEKAGKPEEFSIKILETPIKSFLGFTKRSAKIALLFELKKKLKPKKQAYISKEVAKPKPKPTIEAKEKKPEKEKRLKKEPRRPLWNKEIVSYTSTWIKEVLANMNLKHINFNIEPSEFYLRIKFTEPLIKDQAKEKKLFASFAHLILETLKRKFKSNFRGHKIVLLH